MLRVNTSLTALDLGHNQIGYEGTRHLSDALRVNISLTTLNIDHNQIGVKGKQYLIDTLKINHTLVLIKINNDKNTCQLVNQHRVSINEHIKTQCTSMMNQHGNLFG
jgi:hypothetical protein